MRIHSLLKSLAGAAVAIALAGGAQAAGQENTSTTAPDKTLNDAKAPAKPAPKKNKQSSKKYKDPTTSQGSSGTAGSSGRSSEGTTGTMDNGSGTPTPPSAPPPALPPTTTGQ